MSHKIRIFENFWWNISWFEDKKRQKPKILRCKELRNNDNHFDIQNLLGQFDVVKSFSSLHRTSSSFYFQSQLQRTWHSSILICRLYWGGVWDWFGSAFRLLILLDRSNLFDQWNRLWSYHYSWYKMGITGSFRGSGIKLNSFPRRHPAVLNWNFYILPWTIFISFRDINWDVRGIEIEKLSYLKCPSYYCWHKRRYYQVSSC